MTETNLADDVRSVVRECYALSSKEEQQQAKADEALSVRKAAIKKEYKAALQQAKSKRSADLKQAQELDAACKAEAASLESQRDGLAQRAAGFLERRDLGQLAQRIRNTRGGYGDAKDVSQALKIANRQKRDILSWDLLLSPLEILGDGASFKFVWITFGVSWFLLIVPTYHLVDGFFEIVFGNTLAAFVVACLVGAAYFFFLIENKLGATVDRFIVSLGQLTSLIERQRSESAVRLTATESAIEDTYRQARSQLEQRRDASIRAVEAEHDGELRSIQNTYRQGLVNLSNSARDLDQLATGMQPRWASACWKDWQPSDDVPRLLNVGQLQVSNAKLNRVDGDPQDDVSVVVPACLVFPDDLGVLLETPAASMELPTKVIQSLMLRMLVSIPPSKVRFTMVDPIGLGQSFASFMYLADFDEHLVNSRIWTDKRQIEDVLVKLTDHMENVIQTYLRNKYETLEEYNHAAREVAEPYHVLSIVGFPAGFSEEAIQRLVSIVNVGPKCGVYTLIAADPDGRFPRGFGLDDLSQITTRFECRDERIVWMDRDYRDCDFRVDDSPDADFFESIAQTIGAASIENSRVEVPFKDVAPDSAACWEGTSCDGLNVPLGKAGATKLQRLELGDGTSQHVLVAGKTGSGKSTLLHTLITNTALAYSPDEVEFYLVDFKKGVEFKPYATYELPHARVIAIESEREFGLSVLQGLTNQLKERGDLFREAGVKDISEFRAKNGSRCPRIVLIVDEFQEFFVGDEVTSGQAANLLDRLVRQGRAFGIHVVLGSQTLAGVSRLAGSTIGQIAVRIALECSDADGRLVLGDDNAAARILSRPGEAIYNDMNGLVDGNKPFQAACLPVDEREDFLSTIQKIAVEREYNASSSQIVFEGNAPAEISTNKHLEIALTGSSDARSEVSAWVGEPIAIREPTKAVFRRQNGSNVLVVGQNAEAALGVTIGALVSIVAQTRRLCDPKQPVVHLVDFSPQSLENASALKDIASWLSPWIQLAGRREIEQVVDELSREVKSRVGSDDTKSPPRFLIVFGLQRIRALRKSDTFRVPPIGPGPQTPATPSEQFLDVLRDGPDHGIHALVWCDTVTNLKRAIDHVGLREFDTRLLFQMSREDSSTLVDSAVASKLGLHRAILLDEEVGDAEVFRPYGLPDETWFSWFRNQLREPSERMGDTRIEELARSDIQKWILDKLENGSELRRCEVVERFGCSATTASRELSALTKRGVIEFVGSARTGHYQLTGNRVPSG